MNNGMLPVNNVALSMLRNMDLSTSLTSCLVLLRISLCKGLQVISGFTDICKGRFFMAHHFSVIETIKEIN